MDNQQLKQVCIALPLDTIERVDAIARREDRSRSSVVRRCIELATRADGAGADRHPSTTIEEIADASR